MSTGTVKFFNNAKGFGFITEPRTLDRESDFSNNNSSCSLINAISKDNISKRIYLY